MVVGFLVSDCTAQTSVGGSQLQQSLCFQHLNYAKQVNKPGTGAFLYQSVKYGDILNQQAAGDRDERGGGETDIKMF